MSGATPAAPAASPPPATPADTALAEPARIVDAPSHVLEPEPPPDPRPVPVPVHVPVQDVGPAGEDDAVDLSSIGIVPPGTRLKRRWQVRIVLLVLLVAGELGIAYRSGSLHVPRGLGEARDMLRGASVEGPKLSTPPAPAPLPPPALSANVSSPSVLDPTPPTAKPGILPGMGLLKTADAPPGHRIFVDERAVGQTPQSVAVDCGKVTVRIGSQGQPRPIDVPCGGEISVGGP